MTAPNHKFLTEPRVRTARRVFKAVAVGLGLVSACSADAETGPYFFGASQAFSYESNVFNLEGGAQTPPNVQSRSDAISTTSLNGGIDQAFGRQRFYANGTVGYNKYKNNTQLDNTSYGLDAALDWATVERLKGTLSLALNQGLSNFNLYTQDPQNYQKNVQDAQQAVATAEWGVTPRVSINGGYIYRNVSMSNPQAANNEYWQNTGLIGISYDDTGLFTAGLAFRLSNTVYPNYQLVEPTADEADGKNVDFIATWTPTGLSSFEARLSFTDISHTVNTANDFRGLTGSLRWTYLATGKLTTRLSLLVAPGSGATFADFTGDTTPFVSNSQLSTILRIGATYLVTGKVELNVSVGLENDHLTRQIPNGPLQTGTALNSRVLVAMKYSPLRTLDLLCSYKYEGRSTNSDLTNPYSGNIVLCSAGLQIK